MALQSSAGEGGQAGFRISARLIGLGASTSLAAFGLWWVDPARYVDSPARWLCPFHAATGLYCPICGSTRAVHYLLHGEIGAALHANVLFVLAVPFLAWVWWQMARSFAAGRAWPGLRFPRSVLSGLIVVALLFALLRNLPFAPFNYLAP